MRNFVKILKLREITYSKKVVMLSDETFSKKKTFFELKRTRKIFKNRNLEFVYENKISITTYKNSRFCLLCNGNKISKST